jgi:ubiquinone/menaquinone biosynthesis C-methylase UbiE
MKYPMDPKQIVTDGYNQIAEEHEKWASDVRVEERRKYTSVLLEILPKGAELLELGCGSGIPTTKQLAEKYSVTGVDISDRQVTLAQENVPSAKFLHADMTKLEFPDGSFDAVVAFYSMIHVPRQEQAELLCRISSWLRPGGFLVATMGAHSTEAYFNEDWLGKLMCWSNFDSETNRQLVKAAGLKIISAKDETANEFDKPVTFLWVTAQKPVAT